MLLCGNNARKQKDCSIIHGLLFTCTVFRNNAEKQTFIRQCFVIFVIKHSEMILFSVYCFVTLFIKLRF
jgi:hypothetical protein